MNKTRLLAIASLTLAIVCLVLAILRSNAKPDEINDWQSRKSDPQRPADRTDKSPPPRDEPLVTQRKTGKGQKGHTRQPRNDNRGAAEPNRSPISKLVEAALLAIKANPELLFPHVVEAKIEIVRRLATKKNARSFFRLLATYEMLHALQPTSHTPDVILSMAREGPLGPPGSATDLGLDLGPRGRAIGLLGKIADRKAIDVLQVLIQTEHKTDQQGGLIVAAIESAGQTTSEFLAQLLERQFLVNPQPGLLLHAINSIGNIGVGVSTDLLETFTKAPHNEEVRGAARLALHKIGMLSLSNRGKNLIEAIRRGTGGGSVPEYEWALGKILHFRMRQLAGSLRTVFEKGKERWVPGPFSFRTKVLAAIRQLGGRLSAEEIDLLQRSGRIP